MRTTPRGSDKGRSLTHSSLSGLSARGTHDLDEVVHLFDTPGHTPGNAAAWLHSKDRWALFSGDNIHSPMQVFEPSWSSAFDLDGA